MPPVTMYSFFSALIRARPHDLGQNRGIERMCQRAQDLGNRVAARGHGLWGVSVWDFFPCKDRNESVNFRQLATVYQEKVEMSMG